MNAKYEFEVRMAVANDDHVVLEMTVENRANVDVALLYSEDGHQGFDVEVVGEVLHLMRMDESAQLDEWFRRGGPILMFHYLQQPLGELIPRSTMTSRMVELREMTATSRIGASSKAAAIGSSIAATVEKRVRFVRVTVVLVELGGGLSLLDGPSGGPRSFAGAGNQVGERRRRTVLAKTIALPRPLLARDWGAADPDWTWMRREGT